MSKDGSGNGKQRSMSERREDKNVKDLERVRKETEDVRRESGNDQK